MSYIGPEGLIAMISRELLEILVCPETKEPLELAQPEEVKQVNTLIREGKLKNRGGSLLSDEISGLLRRADGVSYPIRGEVPIMLVDESFRAEGLK